MFGISDSIRTVTRHYKEGNLNWPMIIYITLAHIAGIIGLFSIGQCHKYTLLWAFILWPIRLATMSMAVSSESVKETHPWKFLVISITRPRVSLHPLFNGMLILFYLQCSLMSSYFYNQLFSVGLESLVACIDCGLIDRTRPHFPWECIWCCQIRSQIKVLFLPHEIFYV